MDAFEKFTSLLSNLSYSLTLIFIITFFLFTILRSTTKYKCTVPFGPSGHWLYGHANLPLRELTPTWAAWSQDYGPIFQFRVLPFLPSINIIIVNDVQLCKDFLNNKDFANRENPEDTALSTHSKS
jgi:hypothetical protein